MTFPLSKAETAYASDPRYRALVDSLVVAILNLELSPYEIREAAMYAALRVETRYRTASTIPIEFSITTDPPRKR